MQSNDVCETLGLVFCGADVNCDTGIPEFPTPITLALNYGQKLQVEFLTQNRNIGQFQDDGAGLYCGQSLCFFFLNFAFDPTEIPRSEVKLAMHTEHYMAPPSITHNGFLFKTASMARPITERKNKEGKPITITDQLHLTQEMIYTLYTLCHAKLEAMRYQLPVSYKHTNLLSDDQEQ